MFKFQKRKKKVLKITQCFVDCLIVKFHISKLKFSRFQEYEKASNHNLLTYLKIEFFIKKKEKRKKEKEKKRKERKRRDYHNPLIFLFLFKWSFKIRKSCLLIAPFSMYKTGKY